MSAVEMTMSAVRIQLYRQIIVRVRSPISVRWTAIDKTAGYSPFGDKVQGIRRVKAGILRTRAEVTARASRRDAVRAFHLVQLPTSSNSSEIGKQTLLELLGRKWGY